MKKLVVNGKTGEKKFVRLSPKEVAEITAERSQNAENERRFGYIARRAKEYPDLREFADAYVKQAAYDRMQNGRELIQPMDDYVNKCLAVKAKHLKPKD